MPAGIAHYKLSSQHSPKNSGSNGSFFRICHIIFLLLFWVIENPVTTLFGLFQLIWNQGMLQNEDVMKSIMANMKKEAPVFSKLWPRENEHHAADTTGVMLLLLLFCGLLWANGKFVKMLIISMCVWESEREKEGTQADGMREKREREREWIFVYMCISILCRH